MRDLIEHPIAPLAVIRAARAALKPGGVLLLHTPNGGEAGSSIETGKEWVGFRVDFEHLQYLSSRTINWIAQHMNLRIEYMQTSGSPVLKGIDRLPKTQSETMSVTRNALRNIPGLRRTVQLARAIRTELTRGNSDPRLGAYHLFAILRKL